MRSISILCATSIASILSGCAVTEQADEDMTVGSIAQPVTGVETKTSPAPRPVAALKLDNGNTVEFYDFGRGAIITETGVAYVEPRFDRRDRGADKLVEMWNELAPKTPAPKALVALQARMAELPADVALQSSSSANAAVNTSASAASTDITGPAAITASTTLSAPAAITAAATVASAQTFSLTDCDNGCCDYDWLSTFYECSDGFAHDWFLFDYGYSWANSTEIITYDGMVCAATGQSEFNVSITSGNGGTWAVPQAHYKTYSWAAGRSIWCGGFCEEDMTSSVNSSSDQHLHTYCGGVFR